MAKEAVETTQADPQAPAAAEPAEQPAAEPQRGKSLTDTLNQMKQGSPRTGEAVAEGEEAIKPRAEPEAPPTPSTEEPAEPTAEQPADDRPRDEKGRFVSQAAAADEPGEPAAEVETDEREIEPAAGELEEGAEAAPAATVKLPGATSEDGELEIEVDDPQVAERITALAQRAAEAEQAREQAVQMHEQVQQTLGMRQELEEIRQEMAADPTAFLTKGVRPELREQVVLDLLLDDELYGSVMEKVAGWADDPREREILAANRRAERAERQAELKAERQQRAALQQRADRIVGQVHSFIPADMPAAEARRFYQDMIRDVNEHIERTEADDLSDQQIRQLLAYRFRQYGVNPQAQTNGGPPRDPESGAIVAQPANEEARKIAEARKTGVRLKQSHQKRRVAGATAPSGAGTPANRAGPPAGASLKEALDYARKSVAG